MDKTRIPKKNSHPHALHLFNEGKQYGCSTGIDDRTTWGYGELDNYGFWQHPLYFDEENKKEIKMTDTFDEYKELVKELNTQKQYYAANMINVLIERYKKAEMDKSYFKQYLDSLFDIFEELLNTSELQTIKLGNDKETIEVIKATRSIAKQIKENIATL